MDLIDTLLDNDKTGVKTAINHFYFGGYSWTPESIAPLHTAIEHGNSILVLKMLNAGSLAQIDFDTWLKAAKISPTQSGSLSSLENNQKKYKESLEQPLISAIRAGDAKSAIQLLALGADPNALTSNTEAAMVNEYRRGWTDAQSALDLVRYFLGKLRGYSPDVPPAVEPIQTPGLNTYLENFQPGSYQYWRISDDIKAKLESHEKQVEYYQKSLQKREPVAGEVEKREAVAEIIADIEELERSLIDKGGLVFTELHPDIKMQKSSHFHHASNSEESKFKEYEFVFSFNYDPSMTENRRDAYIKLQVFKLSDFMAED